MSPFSDDPNDLFLSYRNARRNSTDPLAPSLIYGSHFVFKDLCEDFNATWVSMVNKLTQLFVANPFSSMEFKDLVETLAAVWESKTIWVPI